MIAAIKRGAAGPAAASGQPVTLFHQKIGTVCDELCVEAHDGLRELHLRGIEKRFQVFSNRQFHQGLDGRQIGFRGEAMGEQGLGLHWCGTG